MKISSLIEKFSNVLTWEGENNSLQIKTYELIDYFPYHFQSLLTSNELEELGLALKNILENDSFDIQLYYDEKMANTVFANFLSQLFFNDKVQVHLIFQCYKNADEFMKILEFKNNLHLIFEIQSTHHKHKLIYRDSTFQMLEKSIQQAVKFFKKDKIEVIIVLNFLSIFSYDEIVEYVESKFKGKVNGKFQNQVEVDNLVYKNFLQKQVPLNLMKDALNSRSIPTDYLESFKKCIFKSVMNNDETQMKVFEFVRKIEVMEDPSQFFDFFLFEFFVLFEMEEIGLHICYQSKLFKKSREDFFDAISKVTILEQKHKNILIIIYHYLNKNFKEVVKQIHLFNSNSKLSFNLYQIYVEGLIASKSFELAKSVIIRMNEEYVDNVHLKPYIKKLKINLLKANWKYRLNSINTLIMFVVLFLTKKRDYLRKLSYENHYTNIQLKIMLLHYLNILKDKVELNNIELGIVYLDRLELTKASQYLANSRDLSSFNLNKIDALFKLNFLLNKKEEARKYYYIMENQGTILSESKVLNDF